MMNHQAFEGGVRAKERGARNIRCNHGGLGITGARCIGGRDGFSGWCGGVVRHELTKAAGAGTAH